MPTVLDKSTKFSQPNGKFRGKYELIYFDKATCTSAPKEGPYESFTSHHKKMGDDFRHPHLGVDGEAELDGTGVNRPRCGGGKASDWKGNLT
jgi:hypothetical protein